MASKDTKTPKVPQTEGNDPNTRQRSIYVTDGTWRAAKVYGATHDLSVSRVFELAVIEFTSAAKPIVSARDVAGPAKKRT